MRWKGSFITAAAVVLLCLIGTAACVASKAALRDRAVGLIGAAQQSGAIYRASVDGKDSGGKSPRRISSAWASADQPQSAILQTVSRYSTSFASSGEGRRANIALAASNFNGLIVASGQRLSFNETVGPRTEERGYRTAHVIFGGEYVDGIGGGVCQVSSTLYNAWVRAGLGVEQVRAHTLPASYCALSQDATVSEYIDLILRNDGDGDVVVDAAVKDDTLTFTIYGSARAMKIKVDSKILEVVPPQPCETVYADTLEGYELIQCDEEGAYAIARQERVGYRTCAIAKYYCEGKLVGEKIIRKDRYAAVRGKIVRLKPQLPAQDPPAAVSPTQTQNSSVEARILSA